VGYSAKLLELGSLITWEKHYNKLMSKYRREVARVCGSIKHWFGRRKVLYVGMAKTHLQHVLDAPWLTTYIGSQELSCP